MTGSRRRRLRAESIGMVYQRARQGLDLEDAAAVRGLIATMGGGHDEVATGDDFAAGFAEVLA